MSYFYNCSKWNFCVSVMNIIFRCDVVICSWALVLIWIQCWILYQCKPKITDFDLTLIAFFIQEYIFWLEISVDNTSLMNLNEARNHLGKDPIVLLSINDTIGIWCWFDVISTLLIPWFQQILQSIIIAIFHSYHKIKGEVTDIIGQVFVESHIFGNLR